MFIVFFTFLVLISDQLLKFYILNNYVLYEQHVIIPKLFNFYYVQNKGAGWGLFQGQQVLFIIVTLIVGSYFVYLSVKHRNAPIIYRLTYGLLLGGTLGNLIDRLRFGYVVDMIQLDFINFPIFNVADMAISIGIFILIIQLITSPEGMEYL